VHTDLEVELCVSGIIREAVQGWFVGCASTIQGARTGACFVSFWEGLCCGREITVAHACRRALEEGIGNNRAARLALGVVPWSKTFLYS